MVGKVKVAEPFWAQEDEETADTTDPDVQGVCFERRAVRGFVQCGEQEIDQDTLNKHDQRPKRCAFHNQRAANYNGT